MDACAFKRDLEARGFRLRVDGDPLVLRVVPSSALTHEDRDAIKAHRTELLALVAFAQVWAVLQAAAARWKRRRMPEDSEDFRVALAAYERLAQALGEATVVEQLDLLAVPA